MSNFAQNEMDVDAFLEWAEGRDGHWELRDGRPIMMAPELFAKTPEIQRVEILADKLPH